MEEQEYESQQANDELDQPAFGDEVPAEDEPRTPLLTPSTLPRVRYAETDSRKWRPLRHGEILLRTMPMYHRGQRHLDPYDDCEVVFLCREGQSGNDVQKGLQAAVSRLKSSGVKIRSRIGRFVYDSLDLGVPQVREAVLVQVITNRKASFYCEATLSGKTLPEFDDMLERAIEADPTLIKRSREYDKALLNYDAVHGNLKGFDLQPPVPYIPAEYEPRGKRPQGRPRVNPIPEVPVDEQGNPIKRKRGRPPKVRKPEE